MSFDTQAFANRVKANEERKTAAREVQKIPYSLRNALFTIVQSCGNRSDWFRTCITCEHWDSNKEICNKFGVRPPCAIIVDGCENYVDFDPVPF